MNQFYICQVLDRKNPTFTDMGRKNDDGDYDAKFLLNHDGSALQNL